MPTPGCIADDTALRPSIIADAVARELWPHVSITEDETDDLVRHLEERAAHLYIVNAQFRRTIRGAGGRDYLYAFMRHWTAAWVWKTQGRGASHRLPSGFANGVGCAGPAGRP